MAKTHPKNPNVDLLTIGIIVESLKPSHFRAVVGTGVTVVIVIFSFGFWMAQMKADLDMKGHLIRDNEERVKGVEEQGRLQRKVDTLELETEKVKYELSVANQISRQIEDSSISNRPAKVPLAVRVAPKADR